MNLAEAWVRKCYQCGGVEMGPELDDGVMAINEEYATWTCMGCRNDRDFDRMEPYTEIRLRGVSDSRMLDKARNLDYDEFLDWADEQTDQ